MRVTHPSSQATAWSKLRVLIADDDPILRMALSGLVKRLGHEVAVARDGREAVEAAVEQDFDLLLLDLRMPGMDGLEVATRLRRGNGGRKSPWIVGLSAEPSGEAFGMDAFLLKPVHLGDLSRVLERFGRGREPF
ncbi:response regulator [Tautonia sociabilis]|nr:response regulator [Tautonia sociabilis]